jgi:hypothetical protein
LRLAAAVVVVLGLLTAAGRAVRIAHTGYRSIRAPGHPLRDADIDPLAYFASTEALDLARQTIPAGARYAIVVGDEPPAGGVGYGPLLVVHTLFVRMAFRYWLLPALYTDNVHRAQWVIAYHASPPIPGVKAKRVVQLGPDAEAIEVAR